jgi:decaprenylphospho-beta-D-erythro-pentofuranosid-2-ulose 2-reductase
MNKLILKKRSVVILGASSAIAKGCCKALAEQGATLYLAGRNLTELESLANDLKIRYAIETHYGFFDAENFDSHPDFFNEVCKVLGEIEGVLLAFGYLGNSQNIFDFSEQKNILNRNLIGSVSILSLFANYFEKAQRGFIIGISSVAGERGRSKNYAYDAAKSGLTTYFQGLNQRLSRKNVRVITVKPGFVDTPMTFGKTGMFLVADPEIVGRRIIKQLFLRKDVLYVPWFWRYIVLVMQCIPEFLFKKLSF